MVRALIVIAATAPVVIAAWGAQGSGAAIWAALGVLTGANTQALLGPARSLTLSAASAALVAAATAAQGRAALVGVIVAVAAVLGGAANLRSAGVMSLAPAMATIAGSARLGLTWPAAGGWVLAGGGYAVIVVALARVHVAPKPVDAATVRVHTAVLAVLCGTAAGLTVALGLPHGYWIVLTFVGVVRPSWHESARRLRERLAGTLLGALVPIPLAFALSPRALAAVAMVSLFLFLSYLFAGEYVREVVFLTTTTILIASGGLSSKAIKLDEYRVLWTLAGLATAALTAVIVWYAENRRPARDNG